jgi:hypothetical protein
MSYHTPLGEAVSTLAGRVIAAGVALLFTYSVLLYLYLAQLHLPRFARLYRQKIIIRTKKSPNQAP